MLKYMQQVSLFMLFKRADLYIKGAMNILYKAKS